MKRKKHKVLINICIFCILIAILVFIFFNCIRDEENKNSDSLVDKNNDGYLSDSVSSSEYKVNIYDDEIDFIDADGNIISYVFENDKLSSVQEILFTDSIDEAEALKNFYEEKVLTGEIEKVTVEDKIISVKYNMSYFEEYLSLTKDEIQSLLLKESNFKENN